MIVKQYATASQRKSHLETWVRYATLLAWMVGTICYESWPVALSLFCAVAIHECGHLLAYTYLGNIPPTLSVGQLGMTLHSPQPLSYAAQLWVALAGPCMNLLCFGVLTLFFGFSLPAQIQLVTALYNLMPISILDGGRVCESVSCLLFPPSLAYATMRTVSLFCLVLVICVSICALWTRGEGLYLFFLSFSLLFSYMFGHESTYHVASKEM